jgi:hypothetical protein
MQLSDAGKFIIGGEALGLRQLRPHLRCGTALQGALRALLF